MKVRSLAGIISSQARVIELVHQSAGVFPYPYRVVQSPAEPPNMGPLLMSQAPRVPFPNQETDHQPFDLSM